MTQEERKSWLQKVNWVKEFFTPTNAKNILQVNANVFNQASTQRQIEEYMGRPLTEAEVNQLEDYKIQRSMLSDAVKGLFNSEPYTDDYSLKETYKTTAKRDSEAKGIERGDKVDRLKVPKYKDMMQYLAVDGELPQGVSEAIIATVHNWIATSANDTLSNTDATMNSLLGETSNSDAYIPTEARNLLQGIGTTRRTIVTGKPVMDSSYNSF